MQLSLLFLSSLVAASPLTSVEKRQAATLCEQYGYWSGNGYEVNNNNWGRDAATGGSQCTYVDNSSGSGVSWHATWQWSGGEDNVKSYPYGGKQVARGQKISAISTMETSVSWSYSDTNIRANVAYDVFTAADPDHVNSSGDHELMIWLGRFGNVYPIGSSTGTVNVAGRTWELFVGYNGAMKVYSYVAASPINSYSANVKEFFNHMESAQGFPASEQHLIVFQMGTEPFTGGETTFTVDNFSANIS
ncbi:concanavalin A-like lectin/glucanase domain-containing protein [Chaetomium fimeti]|uniref:Concanavalin A-like lectin/glucanase domain-containing protein n=1 Tax=Chaetomium fimeti TaxID=1854472 RepID=A0AAE0LQU5_9PEZI|nr:concanavalin A-like lectin/glucanase domain-containing protein [Chaetomium fimeti]